MRLLDSETLLDSSQISPQILEVVQANLVPPLNSECWSAHLKALTQHTHESIRPPEPSLVEEYKDIPLRVGCQSTMKAPRPANPPSSGSALVVSFFGGSWIAGDMNANTAFARAFVRLSGATSVSPSYRLAPEHKFPVDWDYCWDTGKWLDEHAHAIGADPKQDSIVGGVSAGGVLAAAISANAVQNPSDNSIAGQLLCVPSITNEAPEKYKPYFLSHEQNRDALTLATSMFDALTRHTACET